MFLLLAIFINSQFNLLNIEGQPASSFAGKGRPVFLRMVTTGCPYAPPSVAQWEEASKLFPQVDFVTYDCWKDNGQGVCTQFLKVNSSPYHVLIKADKLEAYPDGFGNPSDISTSPQRFITTIQTDTGLYPLAPPILKLIPQTTDSFANSSMNPIFIVYDSTQKDNSNFVDAWTKAANEDLYPQGNDLSFGILDSSKYPDECKRWTQSEKLESPTAVIYSSKTGHFVKLQSYFSIVSNVRRLIMNLNLLNDVVEFPKALPVETVDVPHPTPVPSDYTVVKNDILQQRDVATIKQEYIDTFNFNGKVYSGELATDKTCTQITPSEEDHAAALKVLNYLRNLAGLSDTVVENDQVSSDCQDTALIIHKIGVVPPNHVVNPLQIPKTCTQGSDFIQTVIETAAKSNLGKGDSSCYQSISKFVLDEGSNNQNVVGHRRTLLYPQLSHIGMGYYPVVDEPVAGTTNVFDQKPAVSVIYALDEQPKDTAELPDGINFVSWPPAGPFPIDQLPSTWHISYEKFTKSHLKSIDDLDIYITLDDGTPLPFTAKLEQDQGITKDTITMFLDSEALEYCQVMHTITVQVINDKEKYSLEYSFTLFGTGDLTEICLYNEDSSNCPSTVPSNHQFSSSNFASNNDALNTLTGNSNVKIYVVEDVDISDTPVKITAPRAFFTNAKVTGTFEIGTSTIVDFQDPSNTDFIIEWDPTAKKIGYLSTSGSPKSILISTINTNANTEYQSLPFFNGNKTLITFKESIINFRERDVFNSLDFNNGEYLACSYSLLSIAEYSVGYEKYYDAPYSILIDKNSDMEKQHTYRQKVKIYTSEEILNETLFIPNAKKDYTIVAPKIGQKYYLYCTEEAEKRINSLTIEPDPYNKQYSSITYFDLSRTSGIRNKCNIPNVTINGVPYSGYSDTNPNAFLNIQGDPIAVNYYSTGAKRNLIITPEPTTNDNFPGKHILNIVFDKSEFGSPSSSGYNPIIYTPDDYDEYTIIQPEEDRNDYEYKTYEFRPVKGAESKPVILNFYREIGGTWEFAPKFINDFQGIWFSGYKNVTIHFNAYPLKRVDGKYVPTSAIDKYHYDSCETVTLIGTKEIPVPDPENPPEPEILDIPIEIKNDQPTFSFNNGNPYQIIKPKSVVVSATTVFEAKNVETPTVEIKPQTYSTIKEMKITESINVDSGSITLNKCSLSDGIDIVMKKNIDWPQLSLVETSFNPKEVIIDVGVSNSAKVLLDDNEQQDLEPHVVVDGIENGKCEELNDKIVLQNKGTYKHYCLNDNQIIVSQLAASDIVIPGQTPIPPQPEKPTEEIVVPSTDEIIATSTESGNDPNAPGNNHDENKLSKGAIIGIAVGVVCGVALIVGVVVFLVVRSKKSKEVVVEDRSNIETNDQPGSSDNTHDNEDSDNESQNNQNEEL